ncbi:MAG: RdgB/HAM1 family non-canonical purine NTP pyrophosphatase [Cyclobacteriaceae bacterium]
MKICFATNNAHKLQEVKALLDQGIDLQSLSDIRCAQTLPENQKTLEGNSLEKAEYVYDHYGVNCFADDTGLEVYALDGAPGVFSARYASSGNSLDNINLLLKNLEDQTNRRAQFRTVITLIIEGKRKQFEGIVKGKILEKMEGEEGFGYDPIFVPGGHELTFAQMDFKMKNSISHRGQAIKKLVKYLNEL